MSLNKNFFQHYHVQIITEMRGGFIQFKDNVAEKHDSQWCRANASKIFAQIEAISKMLELPNSKGKDVPIAGSKSIFPVIVKDVLFR